MLRDAYPWCTLTRLAMRRKTLCQGYGPEHPGTASKARRHDVVVDVGQHLRNVHIAVQKLLYAQAQARPEVALLHDPTAKDKPLWGEGINQRHQGEGQIVRFEFPGRVLRRQRRPGLPPTRLQGWSRRQSFQQSR